MYNLPELIRNETFLEEFRSSVDLRTPPPILRCAKIKITSRCNLRCIMCSYWKTRSEETLTTERWREVFAELADLGCRKIHFSGGEVFLRKDFLDLAEDAARRGIKVNMTTNGTLVDRDGVKRMADIGVNGVSVSLDGPKASTHDRIRGREDAFKKSVRTIRWIRRDAPRVKARINFVVMKKNFRKLPEMVHLAGELGVRELIPMPVDEKKKGKGKNRLSKEQIREYNREIAPRVAELRGKYGFSLDPHYVYPFGVTETEIAYSAEGQYARGFFEHHPCLAPWLHMFVAWNGDVYLCCMTNGRMDALGNVGKQPVRDVFHGEGYRTVRENFIAGRHLASCHRCDLFPSENALLRAALDQAGDSAGAVGRPASEAVAAGEQPP